MLKRRRANYQNAPNCAFCTNFCLFVLKSLCILPIAFLPKICYNINVRKGSEKAKAVAIVTTVALPSGQEKNSKKFEKPLDKLQKICYNIITKRKGIDEQ